MENLERIFHAFDKLYLERSLLNENLLHEEENHEYWSNRYAKAIKARSIVQEVAQSVQRIIENRIGQMVSKALESIFEDPYSFVVEFIKKRNQIECELWLERGGEKVKPFDAVGGGVIDIVSFACRVAFWSLKKTRPIMIMDEPFKNLSKAYQPAAGEMIKKISDKLGLQIIFTTHIQELADVADNVIELRKE